MHLTPHQAKYIAHDLTLQHAGGGLDRLSQALFNASVDLNPHQIEAAVFALRSPLSKGVLLADEVGLGKTIEAGFTSLPWSVTVSTTDPGVLANVVAQWDTAALGCRILVDDKLKVEDFAEGRDAQAFCLDKTA